MIKAFQEDLKSTSEIAKEWSTDIKHVKTYLISKLGKNEYLKVSRRIGANKINQRAKNDRKFFERISKIRRDGLHKKLKELKFKQEWLLKSKKASIKGQERAKELLLSDNSFRRKWVSNCAKGGKKSFRNKLGAFSPENLKKRKWWSIKGLKNTGRKIRGPNEELMYNKLEMDSAKILESKNIDYTYEKITKSEALNGFFSFDFYFKLNNEKYFIEVTCWDKFEEKVRNLEIKWEFLNKNFPDCRFYVVTANRTYKGKYAKFLDKKIELLTLKEFKEMLENKI